MKSWLSILVVALVLAAAVFGVRSWQERQRMAAGKAEIQKILAKDGGYMESVLGAEKNESSLNFKEFFDLCEKAIDGKRALTVELRGAAVGLDHVWGEEARAFIDAGQEVIRAKRTFYQRQLELSAIESKDLKDVRAMHIPNVIDRIETIQRYNGQISKASAIVEQMDKGATEYAAALRKYAGLETAMLQEWAGRGIVLQGTAEQYQPLNMKAVKTSQGVVELLRAELNTASATLTQAVAVTQSNLPGGSVPPIPVLSAGMALEGKKLYEGRGICFNCHGILGRGDAPAGAILNPRPTDLTNKSALRFNADEERFLVIKNGIPRTGMVPMAKTARLSDDDIWNLVAYLKVLSR